MDVYEPEPRYGKPVFGDHLPVRHHDDRIKPGGDEHILQGGRTFEGCWLEDLKPALHGRCLDGRALEVHAPALRFVRLGDDEEDLVASGLHEGGQGGHGELRGAHEGEPHILPFFFFFR